MDWLRAGKRALIGELDEFVSDARPCEENPRRWDIDPDVGRRIRRRRRAVKFLLLTMFLAGSVMALFGERGYFDLRRVREQERRYAAAVEELRERVAVQQGAIRSLTEDPLSRERIAREQLGLLRQGEVDFMLPRRGGDGMF